MSKLMWIAGILLIAAGIAFGAVNLVSHAPVRITLDAAAILLVGGILALGMGSIIDGLKGQRTAEVERVIAPAAVASAPITESSALGAKAVAEEAADAEKPEAEEAVEGVEVSEPTRDTIAALEQARQKMESAFESKPPPAEPAVQAEELPEAEAALDEPVEEAAADDILEDEVLEEETVQDDGQLYVVEERFIRRRPARILSDGTVEAETEEGWMRFENLEHLDEYLDAVEPARG